MRHKLVGIGCIQAQKFSEFSTFSTDDVCSCITAVAVGNDTAGIGHFSLWDAESYYPSIKEYVEAYLNELSRQMPLEGSEVALAGGSG